MSEGRGFWQYKSGAKNQSRSSASQRLNPGPDKSPLSSKGAAARGQGTGTERATAWQGQDATQHPDVNSSTPPEDGLPINGYDAIAVEAAMKVPAGSFYRPPPSVGSSASSPRSSKKPNNMANGKDFWADLRKQYTALQRSGGTREGG